MTVSPPNAFWCASQLEKRWAVRYHAFPDSLLNFTECFRKGLTDLCCSAILKSNIGAITQLEAKVAQPAQSNHVIMSNFRNGREQPALRTGCVRYVVCVRYHLCTSGTIRYLPVYLWHPEVPTWLPLAFSFCMPMFQVLTAACTRALNTQAHGRAMCKWTHTCA
jgi:hypothetical protein